MSQMHAADTVIEKLQDQVKTLVNRNWPDINQMLDDEGELKIAFGVTLTNRDTQTGEQADKSDRLKMTLAFAKRYTDSVECKLTDHPELPFPLNGPCHTPDSTIPTHDDDGYELADDVNLSSPGAVDAGQTPIGEALDAAVSKTEQPLLNIALDESGWTVKGLRTDVRVKAKKAGWSAPALSLFLDQYDALGDNLERCKDFVRPHTAGGQTTGESATEAEPAPQAEEPAEPVAS